MRLGLGNFTGDVQVGPGCNGRLHITLSTSGTPGHTSHNTTITWHTHWRFSQDMLHMCRPRTELDQSARRITYKAEILIPKTGICAQTQLNAQLRVVTQFRVCIQRKVVGPQVHTLRQQETQALTQPARDPSILSAPKQTMVHQQCIGILGKGCFNKGLAGRHTRNQFAHRPVALHLQTVGAIVFEAFGLQQLIECAPQGLGIRHVVFLLRLLWRKEHRPAQSCEGVCSGRLSSGALL